MTEIKINHPPRHEDPTIAAFLKDGGYDDLEEWAEDSDYFYSNVSGEWHDSDTRETVDLTEQVMAAIESSGFQP